MLKAGDEALDFALSGPHGAEFSLSRAIERGPLLLIFFKVSCATSRFTTPFVDRLYQQVLPLGGQVCGVSQDAPEPTTRFASDCGLSFPIVLDDAPYRISREFGLEYVPSLFLIAQDRSIAMSFDGFSKPDLLEAQRFFAHHFSFDPPPLFEERERVPQYKPG